MQPDLFENPPKEIQKILDKYPLDRMHYNDCSNMLTEVQSLGYTFEYGLDAEPFNLRKL